MENKNQRDSVVDDGVVKPTKKVVLCLGGVSSSSSCSGSTKSSKVEITLPVATAKIPLTLKNDEDVKPEMKAAAKDDGEMKSAKKVVLCLGGASSCSSDSGSHESNVKITLPITTTIKGLPVLKNDEEVKPERKESKDDGEMKPAKEVALCLGGASSSFSDSGNRETNVKITLPVTTTLKGLPVLKNDEKKKIENEEDGYDPMLAHYMNDVGLGVDFSGNSLFKETNPKDVPCKFHDGISGKCWKGDKCVYGHEPYTGGLFAKKHSGLAFAASMKRGATPVTDLPVKPTLNREREIICHITHVESPGEFYIRSTLEGATCRCMKVDNMIKETSEKQRENVTASKDEPMDNYFFGFSSLEIPECLVEDTAAPIYVPITEEEKLNCYLNTAFKYKKFQHETYFPNVELIAARVNNKWKRAVVQFYLGNEGDYYGTSPIRVQLLDTGEKVILNAMDICRLPEQFCSTHAAAFHCALFRVSPVWFVWAKNATNIFKELVKGKQVRVIVKDDVGQQMGNVSTFEPRPYYVKILVDKENSGVWTDVAQELIDSGYGLEWNLMPYRPFGAKVTDTNVLEFLHQSVPEKLPPRALEIENKRLIWDIYDKKKPEGKEDSSGSEGFEIEKQNSRNVKSINVMGSVDKGKSKNYEDAILEHAIESGLVFVDDEKKSQKKIRIQKWAEDTEKFLPGNPFTDDCEHVDRNNKP